MNVVRRIGKQTLCIMLSMMMVWSLIPGLSYSLVYAEDGGAAAQSQAVEESVDKSDKASEAKATEEAAEEAEAKEEKAEAKEEKESPKAEEPKEEPKAEEPKEEPKAEEPKEEPKAEEPAAEPKEAAEEESKKDSGDEPKEEAADVSEDTEEAEEDVSEDTEEAGAYGGKYSKDLKTVAVDVETAEDAFKEEVKLVVKPLDEDSDEYADAEKALEKNRQIYTGMLAFDIHFENAKGKEIEPSGPVSVTMNAKKEALKDISVDTLDVESVQITHIGEKATEVVADTSDKTDGTVDVNVGTKAVKSIESTFEVENFSTFTLTWGTDQKATIYFIDMNTGDEIDSENLTFDTTASSFSIDTDFPGYHYSGATYCTPGQSAAQGVTVESVIHKNADGTWSLNHVDTENQTTTEVPVANGSEIYAYYYKPGSPNPSGSGDTSIPSPTTEKTVTKNENGTYTVQLDITGAKVTEDNSHYVNVLVILDATRSMIQNNSPKWANAKAAMKTLIETLCEGENAANAGKIDFSLVTFGRAATVNQGWTKDNVAFKQLCAGLNTVTTSGTNWEAGMRGGLYGVLNTYPEGETAQKHDPTYVIFLTDGDPNVYYQSGSATNYTDNGTTPGYSSNSNTSAQRSADEAKSIAASTNLYGIYCGDTGQTPSGDSYNRLVSVITGEGQGGQKTIAANADTIESEFKKIAETALKDIGASNASVDDGIPQMASVSSQVVEGDVGGYEYYIKRKNDADFSKWDDAPGASFNEENGVTWDLKDVGTLEAETTYRVKFTVWPSQAAYDLIADLNNGLVKYDDLDPDVQEQIGGDKTSGYYMHTNTHLLTSYTVSGQEYTDNTQYEEKQMPLPTETISIEKLWHNYLDSRNDEDIDGLQMVLNRGDEEYLEFDVSAPDWKKDNVYISCGQIVDGKIVEPGHDYYVTEKAGEEVDKTEYWEVDSPKYHPMVVNGVMKLFIQDDEASSPAFTIDGHKYVAADDTTESLTAVNERVSWLNLTKKVKDNSKGENADPDQLFEYEVKITEPTAAGSTEVPVVYFSVFGDGQTYMSGVDTTATPWVEESTGRTYYTFNSGDTITLKIKKDWSVRFLNLATGTDYKIEEVNIPDGYALDNSNGAAVTAVETLYSGRTASGERIVATGYPKTTTSETATITGKINQNNTDYSVTYKNEYDEVDFEATKIWNDDSDKAGVRPTAAQFKGNIELYRDGAKVSDITPTITDNGDDTYTITYAELPKYIDGEEVAYTIKENPVPNFYTASTTDAIANGGEITNTCLITEVSATKEWENYDGSKTAPEGAKVTFTLYDDGDATNYTVELDGTADTAPAAGTTPASYESEPWKAKFVNLPKDGSVYTVKETGLYTGYSVDPEDPVADGGTITNSQDVISIDGVKTWDDAKYFDNSGRPIGNYARPEITINLSGKAGNAEVISKSVKLDGTADELEEDEDGEYEAWKYRFLNLPEYHNGTKVDYTVTETGADGYTVVVTGYNVKNTPKEEKVVEPDDTAITIFKVDEATGNKVGLEGAVFTLYDAEGKEVDTYTTDKDGNAVIGFEGYTTTTDVEKAKTTTYTLKETTAPVGYDPNTTEYAITVEEDLVSVKLRTDNVWEWLYNLITGVSADFENGVLTVTNPPKTTEITVNKVWDDADNQDGARPEKLTFTLTGTAGETEAYKDTQEVTVAEDGSASYTWTELATHYDGVEIDYAVTEAKVDDYTTEVGDLVETDTGYAVDVTNKHTPEATSAKVTKAWDDNENQDGKRPDSVEVTLLANNETVTQEGITAVVTLDESNEWTYTWEGLDKKAAGENIEYTVKETETEVITGKDEAEHYAYEIKRDETATDADFSYTVTNKHTPELLDISGKKIWNDDKYFDADGNPIGDYERPEITINLSGKVKDVEIISKSVKLDGTVDGNGEYKAWEYQFTELPKYNGGTEITYTVTETDVNGFTAEIDDFTVENTPDETKKVEGTQFTIFKVDQATGNKVGLEGAVFTLTGPDGKATDYETGADGTVTVIFDGYETDEDVEKAKTTTYTLKEKTAPEGYDPNTTEYTVTVKEDLVSVKLKTNNVWEWLYNLITGVNADFDKDEMLLTVENPPKTTEITVNKVWDDADNQDGVRPEKLTFTLTGTAGETEAYKDTQEVTVAEDGSASYTWTELATHYDGVEIDYAVTEAKVDDYTTEVGDLVETDTGYTVDVTNKHKTEETSAKVKKVWDDNDNQDGKRPDSVEVTLLANNETVTQEGITAVVTLDESNEWTYTWEGLDKKAAGENIEYTVKETETEVITGKDEAEHYAYEIKQDETATDADFSYTVTNKHTPELLDISGKKIWNDDKYFDADGNPIGDYERPEITINLSGKAGEEEVVSKSVKLDGTVDGDGEYKAWEYQFTELPKYNGGTEITYTVTETDVNGFTAEIDDFTVENTPDETKKVEGTQFTIFKVDQATGNKVGLAGAVFTLTGPDGKATDYETGADGTVTVIFDGYETTEDVEKAKTTTYTLKEKTAPEGYDPNTTEYTVTVKEDLVSVKLKTNNVWEWLYNLIAGVSADFDKDEMLLTVENPPKTTEITVNKVWDDADNQDGYRPEKLTFTLTGTAGETEAYKDTQEVTVAEDGSASYTWTELATYYDGVEIDYAVTEAKIDEYTTEVGDLVETDTGYTVDVTNKHKTEETSAKVKKVWDDNDNQDGKRPDSVEVTLLANNETVTQEGITAVVTLDESNEWTYTWEGLDKKAAGENIEYTVKETETEVITGKDEAEHYAYEIKRDETATDADFSYTVTNKHTPELLDIDGEKVWNDEKYFDADGNPIGDYERPEITINLSGKAGDEEVVSKSVTLDGTADETGEYEAWKYQFTKLPKYNDGTEITYTVTETDVDGFTAEIDDFTVNNTPDETKKVNDTSIQILKIDGTTEGKVGLKGAEFTLYDADGNALEPVYTTDADGKVTIEFKGYETDEDVEQAKTTTYTLKETKAPEGYEDNDTVYTITVKEDLVSVKLKSSVWEWLYNLIAGVDADFDKDKLLLTVPNTPKKTEVEATKIWNDASNKDGVRPDEVTFQLYKTVNGVESIVEGKTITLSGDADTWTDKITDLWEYEDGYKIKYTFKELDASGNVVADGGILPGKDGAEYTAAYQEDGVTIRNSYQVSPDKDVTKAGVTIDGQPVKVGETLTYTISYINTSGKTADEVVIKDTPPKYTNFVAGSNKVVEGPDAESFNAGSELVWTFKDVADGTAITVSFDVKVDEKDAAGQTLINKASVNDKDTNEVINSVPKKEVFDSKTERFIDGEPVKIGQVLTYKITYKNVTGEQEEVVITDKIPELTEYVANSADNGGSESDGTITWNLTLEKDEEITVSFKVKVLDDVNGEILENTGNVKDAENDFDVDTNTTTNPTPRKLKIIKNLPDFVDHGEYVEASFAFEIKGYDKDGKEVYKNTIGMDFNAGQTYDEVLVKGIPSKAETVTVEEVYSGNYKPAETGAVKVSEIDGVYQVTFNNTKSDIEYKGGVTNHYGKDGDTYKYQPEQLVQ